MAKFKFNFGSDTSTTLFHNANASGNDFNMYTSCHTSVSQSLEISGFQEHLISVILYQMELFVLLKMFVLLVEIVQ